jgi:hypothetical protein
MELILNREHRKEECERQRFLSSTYSYVDLHIYYSSSWHMALKPSQESCESVGTTQIQLEITLGQI